MQYRSCIVAKGKRYVVESEPMVLVFKNMSKHEGKLCGISTLVESMDQMGNIEIFQPQVFQNLHPDFLK